MKLTKKKLIFIAIAIVSIAAIILGTILVIDYIKNTNAAPTQDTANTLKDQGIEALKSNDETTAKQSFEAAKTQYEELGDTNGSVDMDAQLYLLEHN